MRRIETNVWWPELVALKDELSLRQLAERFGTTATAVSAAFKRNGIERTPAPSGPRRRRVSIVPESTSLAPYLDMLGQVPDEEIASLTSVSVAAVARAREARSIPALVVPTAATVPERPAQASESNGSTRRRRKTSRTGKKHGRPSAITRYEDQLGQVPDRVIAESAGVTVSAVTLYRTRRGIPSARSNRVSPSTTVAEPQPATEQTPLAAPTAPQPRVAESAVAGRYGFRVRSGEDIFVVLAKDIAEAARRAMVLGEHAVDGIERIGPTL